MPQLLVVLPLALFVMSSVLLVFALRGRRVDNHPICRRCGFDLFGKPADSSTCSECGADLSRPRAVRVGRRETRRALVMAVGPLLVVSLGLLGLQGWLAMRGGDWQRHKPAWWLVREAGAVDAATRDAALAELARRISEGSLERGREEALVQKALAHQADWDQTWVAGWGGVVEAARTAGRLGDERWERYLASAVRYTLVPVQPAYRRAHEIGFNVLAGPPRLSAARPPASPFSVGLYTNGTLVTSNQAHPAMLPSHGRVYPHRPSLPGLTPFDSGAMAGIPNAATAWTRFDTSGQRRLRDGQQVTRFSLVRVPYSSGRPWPTTLPASAVAQDMDATWTLLPDARTEDDVEVRRAVEESLVGCEVRHGRDTRRGRESKGLFTCEVTCDAPPLDLVYKVTFWWYAAQPDMASGLSQGASVYEKPVHLVKGLSAQRVSLVVEDVRRLGAPPPQWVDVVLTPWPEAAPVAVSVIGGGEPAFRTVPIQRRWRYSGGGP